MALLFAKDYEYLAGTGLSFEEDSDQRFLIIRSYPLPAGVYVVNGAPVDTVDVLSIIPPNYNTDGCDMFWVYPTVVRADGVAIPAVGGDDREYQGKTFTRWSRHWNTNPWRPKVDNIQTILARIEWSLRNPDPSQK